MSTSNENVLSKQMKMHASGVRSNPSLGQKLSMPIITPVSAEKSDESLPKDSVNEPEVKQNKEMKSQEMTKILAPDLHNHQVDTRRSSNLTIKQQWDSSNMSQILSWEE